MFFGDKLSFDKSFTSSDLLQFIEELVRESRRRSSTSNYEWLKCRTMEIVDMEQYKNIVFKLPPQSCASIAVKLDRLVDENNMAAGDILPTFQKLLEEQQNINFIEQNIKNAKEKRMNKVSPELINGKNVSVSFVLK